MRKLKYVSCFVFVMTISFSVFAQTQTASPKLFPLLDSLTLDTMKGFTSLAEAMKNPDQVVKLVLRKQHYKEFPKEIWMFPNLQYLDLSKNQIAEYPDSLGKLVNLQVLHLSKNKIETLPRELGDNANLKILDINQNDLTMLPPQIGKLKKLEYLDLWGNDIGIFPDELKDIADNLKIMDLRVILINFPTQDRIRTLLPKTLIYFDPPCKCNQ